MKWINGSSVRIAAFKHWLALFLKSSWFTSLNNERLSPQLRAFTAREEWMEVESPIIMANHQSKRLVANGFDSIDMK